MDMDTLANRVSSGYGDHTEALSGPVFGHRLRFGCTALAGLIALFPSAARAASPWRFWNSADGITESYVTSLTPDLSGRLVIKHGNVLTLTVLDGYGAAPIADSHALGRVIPNPDGTLWSLSPGGIDIYEKNQWKSWPVPEIVVFFNEHPSTLGLSWFKHSTPEGLQIPIRVDMFPSGPGTAWILFPDRLIEWEAKTGRTTVVRTSAQTSLTRFHDLQPARDGGVWVGGATGLGRVTKDDSGLHWVDFRGPATMSDFTLPVETSANEV